MELQALWDVSQQFQNKNGSINASGKVFVYFLGRTALATTYTGEDGNVVNSNPILLDNNGRATCYADTKYSYTVVVCDFYGKELFSYDITLHNAISTVEDVIVLGSDGTVLVDETELPNGVQYDLSVNQDIFATKAELEATSAILQEEIVQNAIDISNISAALPNKKDKQNALTFNGGATKTVKKITQNANGEMNVEFQDIDLPPEVPNVEIISPSGTVNIESETDVTTNTKTFKLDVNQREPFWHYWTGNNSWTKIYDGTWKAINRPAVGAGSTPHSWNPTITRGIWDAKAHFTVTFHNEEERHVVPNYKLQIGFRAKLVGQNDPTAIRYIDLGAWVYDPSLYTTEWYQYNFAQESIRQNFDTSLIMNIANYFGDDAFDVYFEAKMVNTDGGVEANVTPIDENICRVEITYFGIHEICNVNGTVTVHNVTAPTYTEGWGIDISNTHVISVDPTIIPEVTGFATTTELAEVSANIISQIPESQVQSNWTETDDTDPSYIQNKPEEIQLIAGTNVEITTSGNSAIISSIGSGDVTESELAAATATLHAEIVNVTANIPEQVQSDWTETDDTDPSFIQNKPSEKSLVAGNNINLSVSGDNVIISSTASGDVMMSDLVNVSSTLHTEITNVSSTLQSEIRSVTSNIPEQVQSNWTESDDTDPSYIQNKPEEILLVAGTNVTITTSGNSAIISSTASGGSTYTAGDGIDITSDVISVDGTIARKTELTTVSGNLHNEIQAVSAAIPTVTPQVQSNWTEDDDTDPSYIQNKPSEQSLVAGSGINIASSGNNVIISAEVPDVTGFATEVQLRNATATLQNEIETVSAAIPEEEEVQFEEIDLSDYALISDIPVVTGFATKADLDTVSGLITPELPVVAGEGIGITETETEITIAVTANFATQSDIAAITANIPTDKLFIAEYGTTSWNDLLAAFNSGKAIFCKFTSSTHEGVDGTSYGTAILPLVEYQPAIEFRFVGPVRYITGGGMVPNWADRYATVSLHWYPAGWTNTLTEYDPLQVQANWNESNSSSKAYIQNKPDLSVYALASDIPVVTGFATKAELQTVSALIPDTSDMATQTWVGEQGYLTSVPSEYITETELTTAVSGFATKTELNSGINAATALIPTTINPLITASITDIQVVNSLPASPVATVLYLIPEA